MTQSTKAASCVVASEYNCTPTDRTGACAPCSNFGNIGAHLMARRPKRMPSSGPRLMVVRARRLAGAWQVRAFMRRWLPFPALAVYTAACRAPWSGEGAGNSRGKHFCIPHSACSLALGRTCLEERHNHASCDNRRHQIGPATCTFQSALPHI